MERLEGRAFVALLDCLRQLYALQSLDAFCVNVLSLLPNVVPSEVTVYNEVNPRKQRIHWIEAPPVTDKSPGLKQTFERHLAEHPVLAYHLRNRDGPVLKISDFLTRSQWHRLALYNEFFRRVGMEHELVAAVPTRPPLKIGITLHRSRADFTERDRLCLTLLRPHLIQAYRNAEAVTETQRELALLREGMGALERGVIVLTREGRVRRLTARARQWLVEYFGSPSWQGDRLPEALRRWVRHQEAGLAARDDAPPPRQPLVVEQEGTRLVVRLVSDSGQSLLLLEEQRTELHPASLAPLGLSRREAEVLTWVAQGKTNAEIATILGTRPRTVAKHLERIYQKLGVETRTAAARVALEGRITH